MEELMDVTVWYIHCLDPAENAARRGRVIEGETRDLMANTAASIRGVVESSYLANQILENPMETELSQDLPQLERDRPLTAGAPPKKDAEAGFKKETRKQKPYSTTWSKLQKKETYAIFRDPQDGKILPNKLSL